MQQPMAGASIRGMNLQLWDLSLNHPPSASLELKPSTAMEGNMHVTTHRGKIYLCWGPLGEALNTVGTLDEHVQAAVARLGRALGAIKELSVDVRNLSLRGHTARWMEITFRRPKGTFTWGPRERVAAVLIHCVQSQRYLILFSNPQDPGDMDGGREFEAVAASLSCHG